MHSLPLTQMRKLKEWTLIQLTALNNNFQQNLLQKLNCQIQHKKPGTKNERNKNKTWKPSRTTVQK